MCILLGALMLMGALSGCGAEEEDAARQFVVRASVCGKVTSLDPAMNTDPSAETVFCALYENLLRSSVDGEGNLTVEPGVAKEYEIVENYDGTVDYVFTLRSAARWSDGTRVRARDFDYAWRRHVDPATESPNHAMLSMVQGYDAVRETGDAAKLGVKADGDTTFRVTLLNPCPYFLSDICTAVPTMPLRSDASRKTEDWTTSTAALCNGPYQVGVWSKEEYMQLRRNPSYYESRMVTPDMLRFLFAPDPEEAWLYHEGGRLDYVAAPPERVEPTGQLSLRTVTCVLYNHMSDVFSDGQVRRAFDLSLDRAAVAAAAGKAMRPATGLVPHGVVGASIDADGDFRTVGGEKLAVDAEGYSMRCLEAETELRGAGYWGGVGYPTVTCLYVAGDEARAAASAAAGIWRERLNVAVTTEGVPREEFDRRIYAGEYDLAIDTLETAYGDAMDYLAPFAGTDGSNMLHYVNKPYDLLIGVAGSSRDPAARTAFLHDAEELLLGDTALSPLYFGGRSYVLNKDLTGVRHDLRGNAYFDAAVRIDTDE